MKTTSTFLSLILGAVFCLFVHSSSFSQSFAINVLQNMCFDDGSAEVVLDGIPEPVTVLWEHTILNETWMGPNPTTLKDGQYTVMVTDANGIIYTQQTWLSSSVEWYAPDWPGTPAPCPGGEAAVDVEIWQGTPPYDVYVNGTLDGVATGNTYTTNPLPIGEHDFHLIDSNGCRSSYTPVKSENSTISVIGEIDMEVELSFEEGSSCGVYDISYEIISGAYPPFQFYWTFWNGSFYEEVYTDVLTDMPNGTYAILHAIDAEGCEGAFPINVVVPNALQASGYAINSNCPNDDGSIQLNVYGGTAPYTFLWSNGATTEDISNLAAGSYSLTVTDTEGCTNTFNKYVGINETIGITGSVVAPNCEESIAGSININVSGTTGGYTAEWNTGETGDAITIDEFGYYSVTVTDGQGCTDGKSFWVPTPQPCHAFANGTTYYDLNGNCSVDPEDFPLNAQVVSTNGNPAWGSSSQGNFNLQFLSDVELQASANNYTTLCPTAPVALAHVANTAYDNIDFFLQPNTLENNLCVGLYAQNPVPGFYRNFTLSVSNPGTTVVSTSVDLAYSTLLDFSSSSQVPSLLDEDTGMATWTLLDILPNTTRTVVVSFYTDPSVALGEEVDFTASILDNFEDVNPDNNIATITRTVVGSYDPNDKQVWPAGIGENNQIDPLTSELEYLIRFQNTGTAPAINVMIEDLIDASTLDLSKIELIETSHELTDMVIEDNKVQFVFEDIYLPDSTTNEPASNGYVLFKIGVNEGLPLGTVLNNSADIYFDFNAPIITNTAFVTLDNDESVEEFPSASFKLFPNPSNGELQLVSNFDMTGITIYDISGRVVFNSSLTNSQTARLTVPSTMRNGSYTLRINGAGKSAHQNFVLMR